jgi:hypothetical protein
MHRTSGHVFLWTLLLPDPATTVLPGTLFPTNGCEIGHYATVLPGTLFRTSGHVSPYLPARFSVLPGTFF